MPSSFPMDIVCCSTGRGGALREHRYRLLRSIGSGGQADVYEAQDLEAFKKDGKTPRQVAIKYSKADASSNEQTVTADAQRFRREAGIAAAIDHRNVIKVINFGVDARNNLILVMPYIVGGRTLSDWIDIRSKALLQATLDAAEEARKAALEADKVPARMFNPERDLFIRTSLFDIETELFSLFEQVLDGVGALHRAGIIHRDLKSTNVLIQTVQGKLVAIIADLGIARCISPEAIEKYGATMTVERGTIRGTPAYMAPEQFMPAALDERADVWALSIILYELITGKRPFDVPGLNPNSLQNQITYEDPYPMSMFVIDPDPSIERVIRKGLVKRPDGRIRNVEEFRQLFKQAIDERRARREAALQTAPDVTPEAQEPSPDLQESPSFEVERPSLSASRATVPSPIAHSSKATMMVGGAAGLLLVVGLGVWFASRSSPTNTTPPQAQATTARATAQPVSTTSKPIAPTTTRTSAPSAPAPTVSAKPKSHPAPTSGQAATEWKDAQSYFAKGKYLFAITSAGLVLSNPEYGDFADAYLLIGDGKRKMGKTQDACKAYQSYRSFDGVPALSADAQAFVDASCPSMKE